MGLATCSRQCRKTKRDRGGVGDKVRACAYGGRVVGEKLPLRGGVTERSESDVLFAIVDEWINDCDSIVAPNSL